MGGESPSEAGRASSDRRASSSPGQTLESLAEGAALPCGVTVGKSLLLSGPRVLTCRLVRSSYWWAEFSGFLGTPGRGWGLRADGGEELGVPVPAPPETPRIFSPGPSCALALGLETPLRERGWQEARTTPREVSQTEKGGCRVVSLTSRCGV